ncbi:MAG: hypothetical protein GY839_05990 [candidate division Zixibacteria bacterium]|nr:hypothetical protein [candidate division Zixibacteria bacterium]
MGNINKKIGTGFLTLGLIFLAIGFVQQEFSFSFENGLFNLGLIFTLSGIVSSALKR